MSNSKRRRRWTAEQKWQIIREARQTSNHPWHTYSELYL